MQATIKFVDGWRHHVEGRIVQGGNLTILFDPRRLFSCRERFSSLNAWEITGELRFRPRLRPDVFHWPGQDQGRQFLDPAWTLQVPIYATEFEVWFSNRNTGGTECLAWDSDYGRNYLFHVLPR